MQWRVWKYFYHFFTPFCTSKLSCQSMDSVFLVVNKKIDNNDLMMNTVSKRDVILNESPPMGCEICSDTKNHWGPILKKKCIQTENTHCVTFGASRLRSESPRTMARSPLRSKHCCRASVQLHSPGRIWKQLEDSLWYTASLGQ